MSLPQPLADLKNALITDIKEQQLSFPAANVTSDGLNWILQNVFQAGSNTITVTAATVTETVTPSVVLTCTFQLFGSVDFDLTFIFTLNSSSTVETSLQAVYPSASNPGGTLQLSDILSKLNVNLSVVPNLVISSITVTASNNYFGITTITFSNTWTVSLGTNNLEISKLNLSLGYTAGTGFSGSLNGNVTISTASFDVLYTMPGNFEVSGTIPSIDFADLVNEFVEMPFTYPSGFPQLTLSNASFKISKTDANYSLNVDVADVNNWGEMEVDIQYVQQQWGYAAGFALQPGWNLSDISSEFNSIKDLGFSNTGLIIASFANTGFAFINPKVTLPQGGIITGVNVFSSLQFPGDTSSALGALGKLVGKQGASLNILAQIPFSGVSGSKLTASLGGTLYIPSATTTSSFRLTNPAIFITAAPSFGVSGTLNVPVKEQTLPIDGDIVVSTSEIGFNAYANTSSLTNPVGFNGVVLEGIGVSMDLEIETLNVALGLEGVFNLNGNKASQDMVAFKFAVAPEDAYPIYLTAQFAQLDLPTIYKAVMNPGNTLPAELGSISFQQLLIYWADQSTILPDGTQVSPGFRFNAQPATFFGFQANAAVQMDFNSGFSGTLDVQNPILVQNGTVLKVTDTTDTSKGPQLSFSTTSSPYLQASVDATLFEMASTSIAAQVTSSSLTFDIQNTVLDFLDDTINLTITANLSNFYFAFVSNINLTLNCKVPLSSIGGMNIGNLQINTGFKGTLNCHLDTQGFILNMQGAIVWEGKTWTMPPITVTAMLSTLSDLPSQIENQWVNNGNEIFGELVSDVMEYLHLIKDGVLTGGTDVVHVLMGVYNKTPDEVISLLQSVGLHANVTIPVNFIGHIDADQHLDVPSTHIDTPAVHIDTNVAHVDTPHADGSKWGIHGDIGHGDVGGHTDTNQPPHGDTGTPHGDTTPHVDTPNVHIDESSFHIDV